MLQGFVPFPPEFAADYRAKGYWRDQSLAQEFDAVFKRYQTMGAVVCVVENDAAITRVGSIAISATSYPRRE